jgi:hypothetical protein
MRVDIHRGPEPPLHPKAGYIDADPSSLSRSSLPTGGRTIHFWRLAMPSTGRLITLVRVALR